MAAYGLLIASSGFSFDAREKSLGFAPKLYSNPSSKEFRCFWSIEKSWGSYYQNEKGFKLEVLWGTLNMKKIQVADFPNVKFTMIYAGYRPKFYQSNEHGQINLDETIRITDDYVLQFEL